MIRKNRAFGPVALLVSIHAFGINVLAHSPEPLHSLRSRFEVAARQACEDRAVRDCVLSNLTFQNLTGGVNFYRAVLRVGKGPFDLIGINRIVNEYEVGSPVDGRAAVFFIHGFVDAFFASVVNQASFEQNPGIAPWLAERGIDFWGIDVRSSFVPATASEFGFMKDWGFGNTVKDVLVATRFARYARRMTGQNFGKLHLAGHSLGASLVYAIANAEACRREREQDVADLIPMETIYKLPPTDMAGKALACNLEAAQGAAISNGDVYTNASGAIAIADAAMTNPEGASMVPGLTNKELALRQPCSNIFLPAFPYHPAACLFDSRGVPTAGRFSSTSLIIDAVANGMPIRSRALMRDYFGIPCDTNPSPFADHLAEIQVPSLYIGAAGGFGQSGTYTNTLLGSSEKRTIFIQLLPSDQPTSDFGHLELLIANDAASLVWQPVLDWVLSHEPRHHRRD